MIAVKNLQNLSEILMQEELIQAVALHYTDMVSDKKASKLLENIIKTSKQNHAEICEYLKSDIGKTPLPKSAGVLNRG
ncbi:MAG: hypothetical protein LBG88_04480 [Christensenellaceae bacterium]|jgi:hypothetical protein|nr:hypothetical protein [Christensenellaceae bacterium]